MVFFSSHEHLTDWSKSSAATGEALTVEQTLKLSVPFYQKKMSTDYVRPSREETIALFQSPDLKGDFWKIYVNHVVQRSVDPTLESPITRK